MRKNCGRAGKGVSATEKSIFKTKHDDHAWKRQVSSRARTGLEAAGGASGALRACRHTTTVGLLSEQGNPGAGYGTDWRGQGSQESLNNGMNE